MKKEKIFISLLTEKLYWVLELRINCSKSSHLTTGLHEREMASCKNSKEMGNKWAMTKCHQFNCYLNHESEGALEVG